MTGRTSLLAVSKRSASESLVVVPGAPSRPPASAALRQLSVRLTRRRMHLDGRRAKFVLMVENRSAYALETFTYASAGRPGEAPSAVAIAVPANASLSVSFYVPVPRERPLRAVTEVHLESGVAVFQATPLAPRRLGWYFAPFAVLAVLVLFLASGFARPSVSALVAPATVLASRPFPVDYVFAWAQGGEYRVVSDAGVEAARGMLSERAGSFLVALPRETAQRNYTLDVTARSQLGTGARHVRIAAEPDPLPHVVARKPALVRPRPAPVFAVDRLAVGQTSVEAGKPVMVYYRVASTAGLVRLIDQYGTVRAEALLDRRGNSILVAPSVQTDQDFRVVVHASYGNAQAERSVSLRVTRARSLDDLLAAARRDKTGPIVLLADTVAAGEPIKIGIAQNESGMRVALVDPQGQEVAASAVASDQNEVTLNAPAVAGPARYSVTATYKDGVSEQTIIRYLTIGGPAAAMPGR